MKDRQARGPLQLWGGIECTVNRLHDRYCDQFVRSGHTARLSDLDRVAELGIRTLRHGILWERTAPESPDCFDWGYADASMERLQQLGIEPIVGLLHHGSGPRYTDLLDSNFPEKLGRYARAVAERYPWVTAYTPVNEPLTTARFSALYGHWYPHTGDDHSFSKALLNEVKATALAMAEIRKVNPNARLIQTEDLGKTHATSRLKYQATFENTRRWVTWDLQCGMVNPHHRMWGYFRHANILERDLAWFLEHPCPPDVLGLNYYITSERFIDERLERYPARVHGGNGKHQYADVEAVRVLAGSVEGAEGLLLETWERYRRPIAITECHLGCTREEQMRWLQSVWNGAERVREEGANVEAVTVWSMFGAFDWNSLLCCDSGCYEPGVFDLRAPEPRATGITQVIRSLAKGETLAHPVMDLPGWWERPVRLEYPPVVVRSRDPHELEPPPAKEKLVKPPILIVGRSGTLARAFGRLCELRGLPTIVLGRPELDMTRRVAVTAALEQHKPWAVVNTGGYVRVDDAESDETGCFAANTLGPALLAEACAMRGIPLVTYSSDLVFDGTKGTPYVETDATSPLNVYGRSKAEAEMRVLKTHPDSLVVRTSAFFGPWDEWNFLHFALQAAAAGSPFLAAEDQVVSPTYVPHLVHATLDLLIDGERGLWHLANQGSVSWADFARMGVEAAGLSSRRIRAVPGASLHQAAPRPANVSLRSERGWVMPTLEEAIVKFLVDRELESVESEQAYVA